MPNAGVSLSGFFDGLLALARYLLCLPGCLLGRRHGWSKLKEDDNEVDVVDEFVLPGRSVVTFNHSSAQAAPPAWVDLDRKLSDVQGRPMLNQACPVLGASTADPGAGPGDLIDILADAPVASCPPPVVDAEQSRRGARGFSVGAVVSAGPSAGASAGRDDELSNRPLPASISDPTGADGSGGLLAAGLASHCAPWRPPQPAGAAGIGAGAPGSPFGVLGSTPGVSKFTHQRSVPADFGARAIGTNGGMASPFAGAGLAWEPTGRGLLGDRRNGVGELAGPGRSVDADRVKSGAPGAHKRAVSASVRKECQLLALLPQRLDADGQLRAPDAVSGMGGQFGNGLPGATVTVTRTRSAPMPWRMPSPDPEGQEAVDVKKEPKKLMGGEAGSKGGRCEHVLCAAADDIGQRRSMEDRSFAGTGKNACCPKIGAFLGVFDGHNGAQAAQFSSEHFMPFLADALSGGLSVGEALEGAFRRCEEALFDAWKEGEVGDAGTTALVCALTSDDHLHLANAGDCRAVLSRSGRAEALTKDHKPGNELEKRRILACGGFLDDDGYLNGEIGVSRCFGDFHLSGIKRPRDGGGPLIATPDLVDEELSPSCEFVIVGSDGLWDVLSNQRAVDMVRAELNESRSAEKAAEKLVFEAKLKESRDNITAGLMVLRDLPLPARRTERKRFVNSRLRLSSRSLMDLKHAIQNADAMPLPRPI
ncbi:unnamed protein product [Ostreobium quekettii]|uniref:PPM-type phosphatase domain-containing protein n=1 Tax=Ostreobium quekettii TaxID=121088 RepID=A0A8S1JAA2_9CHLO|nr:unnamed protein product [Ostreobium quekettii]